MSDGSDQDEDLEAMLNKGAFWAVTYGDLMSYLMIFFLMAFVFSISKDDKYQEDLSDLQAQFGGTMSQERKDHFALKARERDLARDIKEKLSKGEWDKLANVQVNEQKIQITLRERVLFDSGEAELKDRAKEILHEFADLARNLPNPVMIEGHTDDVPVAAGGEFSSNFQLSMARAYSVIRYLIEAEKFPAKRLSGVGYGEYRPMAPNSNQDNRAMNRRIEIALIRAHLEDDPEKKFKNGQAKGG